MCATRNASTYTGNRSPPPFARQPGYACCAAEALPNSSADPDGIN